MTQEVTPQPGHIDDSDPNVMATSPAYYRPLASRPWALEHPGVVLSLAGVFWAAAQWAAARYVQDSQAPNIEKIHHDIRTLATHQLEAQRSNREILSKIAERQGIQYSEPQELRDAEAESRKLRAR